MAKSKIFSLLFTAFVIGLLVVTGPVQSFSLDLDLNKIRPEKGETITFTADITIDSGERVPIDFLTLELTGPETQTCKFTPQGQIIEGCKDITVTKLQDSDYAYGYGYNFGYGYGFTEGKLSYRIRLDTSDYKTGEYTTELKVKIQNDEFSKKGPKLTIKNKSGGEPVCYPEWDCDAWSPCIQGLQFRTCYRNLNYCYIEEKPIEERTCSVESDAQYKDTMIILNTAQENKNIPPETKSTITLSSLGFSEGLQFIIILLLLNCIITTLNIIVKVTKLRNYRKRRFQNLRKNKK
ncbi:MAG: hypothetical protein KJ718_01845 [Nanoarchaeota archaeon]|nr:hypothetical protein [Nanoarchaeota archaeon]MBU1051277.1 hypothetical protein [Nanoarchaeota archaeon]MBU1988899.1 hypothetical protein [Nanoarchaeota archaeon]